jgi:hypothetical protein
MVFALYVFCWFYGINWGEMFRYFRNNGDKISLINISYWHTGSRWVFGEWLFY